MLLLVLFDILYFKYRILDTEFIIKKRSCIGITQLYCRNVSSVCPTLILYSNQIMPQNKQLLNNCALIVIVTFSFDFVNKKAKDFVDKQFYRERYIITENPFLFSEELPLSWIIWEKLLRISEILSEILWE